MKRVLFAAVLVFLAPFSASAQDEAADDVRFQAMAKRYHAVVDRRPQKGTGFDLLYRHYLDAGKLDELAAHYESQANEKPNDAANHLVLGLIHERRHRNEEALQSLSRAAELSPDDYRPHYYQALLLSRLYRADDAIAAFQKALKLEPDRNDLLDIHKKLGRLYASQGKTEDALRTWSELAEKFPADVFVIEELAELLVEEEQYDAAIERYEQLAKLSTDDLYKRLVARVQIGQAQVRQGKLKTAIETFETCLAQVRPDSWMADDIRRRIEETFQRSGDNAGLVDYYRQRLEKHPDDLDARVRLAAVLSGLDNRKEALEQYEAALRRAPSRRDIRELLIDELVRDGQFPAAIDEAESLLKQDPNDLQILTRLGHLYREAGGEEADAKAIETWRRLAAVRPDDPVLAVQAAELCRGAAGVGSRLTASVDPQQNRERAETALGKAALELYREAVRRAPATPQYHEYLGEYLFAAGQDEEALAAWRQIAAPPQDTAENLRRLAEILAGVGRLEEATEAIEQAIARQPDRYELHEQAADLFAQQEDYDAALEHVARMEQLADTPYFEEQALAQRVEIYRTANRLSDELDKLSKQLESGQATARDYWLAGMMASAQRRSAAALKHLDKALELSPQDLRLVRYKAEVHQQAGDLTGAAELYRRLAEGEPRRRSDHLRELTRLLLELGRIEEAQKTAEELVQFSPGSVESVEMLAEVHLRAGKVEEALEAYRRAVLTDPRNVEARLALAGRLGQHQRIDEAIEHYWRAFEQSEEFEARISIAGSLAEQHLVAGRLEQLVERLGQWRRDQEDPFVATLCLVEVLGRAEEYAGARRELNTLLAQRPNDVQVLAQLAALADRVGDKQAAAEHWEKIAAVSPDPRHLQKLADLYGELGEKEKAQIVYRRLGELAQDDQTLLTAIDRALGNGDYEQAAALAAPPWNARPDDWRFGARLALAYWLAGQREDAARLAETIADLPPNSQYDEKSSQAASQLAWTRYGRNLPPLVMRVYYAMQMHNVLTRPETIGSTVRSMLPQVLPRELSGAQQLAVVILSEAARAEQKHDEFLAALRQQAETDLDAMRRLAWVYLAEVNAANAATTDEVRSLLNRWIEQSPQDAEPRVMLMTAALSGRRAAAPTDPESLVAEMKEHHEWLTTHRPDVARFTAAGYVQLLMGTNRREEARTVLKEVIDGAQDVNELTQVVYLANQLQDAELFERMIARIETLGKGSSPYGMGSLNLGQVLGQSVQVAVRQRDWDRAGKMFTRYLAATHPAPASSLAGASPAAYGTYTSYTTYGAVVRTSRRTGNVQFPLPTRWLDSTGLSLLTALHRAFASAGEADRLTQLVEQQIEATDGSLQQCWRMCRVVLHWRANEEDQALAALQEFSHQAPGDLQLRMLLAQAHGQLRQHDQALAILKGVQVPFGSQAKELEQLRLELAQQAGDDAAAKESALRLFGMRLTSDEQSQLAQTLRRFGENTRAEELMRRAVRTAGGNAQQLYSLMQQNLASDPQRAAEIARTIIRQTPRSSQPNDNSQVYRMQALQILQRGGELKELIEAAEAQLAAAPNSVKLLEDLSEYYLAAGDQENAMACLERVAAVRPDDPALNFRVAQSLLARGKVEAAVEQLGPVWEKNPQLVMQRGHEFARHYARAGKLDLLAEHLGKLKGNPILSQYSYEPIQFLQYLQQSGGDVDVDSVIKAYRVVLEITPREMQSNVTQNLAGYLIQKNRKGDAYDLYKQAIFADKDASTAGAPPVVYFGSGTPMGDLRQLADLAHELGKQDDLRGEIEKAVAAREGWNPVGELLSALLDRRKGDEQPLAELGRRWLTDDKFPQTATGSNSNYWFTLREELAACQAPEVLHTAIEVWHKAPPNSPYASYSYNDNGQTAQRVADLWMRLKQPEKARESLLKALESETLTTTDPRYAAQQSFQRRTAIASALGNQGFYLDALAAYRQAFEGDLNDLDPNDYVRRQQAPQAEQQMHSYVIKLLAEQKDAALTSLADELKKDSPDLARFFVVVDPLLPRNAGDPFGAVPIRQFSRASVAPLVQLLPSLLAEARETGKLDELSQLAADRLTNLSQDAKPEEKDRLTALGTLIALYGEDSEKAAASLRAWIDRLEKEKSLAGRDVTWLLALAALEQEPTRIWGQDLALTVATQAGARGDAGRQQAAIAALTTYAGDRGKQVVQDLLARRRGDPQLRYQAAEAYFQQKKYDEAIALLETVWRNDPDLLLPQIAQLAPRYVEAGRLDALAAGLKSVRDDNLSMRYGSNVIRAIFPQLPKDEKHLDSAVQIYQALRDFMPTNVSYLASNWNNYLRGLPRSEKTLAVYLQTLFDDPQGPAQLQYFADPVIELATSLKKPDQLRAACRKAREQHPAWHGPGELLLAIIEQRGGDEKPLLAVAEKHESDPSFAAQMQPVSFLLRRELARSNSRPALETALKLWQPLVASESGDSWSSSTQTADLLVKLDRREEARRMLLAVVERPFVLNYNSDEDYIVQQRVQLRMGVARKLAEHNFHAEALAVFASVSEIEVSGLRSNSYALRQVQEASEAGRNLVQQVISQHAHASLDRLEAELRKAKGAPDLASFFAVFDPPTLTSTSGGHDPFGAARVNPANASQQPPKPDALLPGLLEHARSKNRLDRLMQLTAEARKRHPEAVSLAALDVLLALAHDPARSVDEGAKALLAHMEKTPSDAASPAVWLAARSLLKHEPTRELGEPLAQAVAEAAAKNKNRPRQEAAVTLLTESLRARGRTEQADALLRRLLLGDDARPDALLQLARVQFRGGKGAAAASAMATVWTKQPELALSRLEEFTPLYVQAGQTEELAKALRSVKDENLRTRYAYEVTNAIQPIGNQKERIEDAIKLLDAAVEFAAVGSRDYPAGRLTDLLLQQERKDEAWSALGRSVTPPGGNPAQLSSNAARWVEMTIEQNKIDPFHAAVKEAAEKHPQWQGCADLVIAMLSQRQKDESPLIKLARKFQKDAAYAATLRLSTGILRSELARCEDRTALELAAALWESQIAQTRSQDYRSNDTTPFTSLAQIYGKLGRQDKAREMWRAAIDAPTPGYDGDYLVYYLFQRREQIAPKMIDAGLYLDALRLFHQNQAAAETSAGAQYRLGERFKGQSPQVRRAILGALTEQAPEALEELQTQLADSSPPDLAPFFLIAPEPWTAAEQGQIPEAARGASPADVQLLPAVLRLAHAQGKLAALGEAVEKEIKQYPGDRRLAALAVLIDAAGEMAEQEFAPLLELLRSDDRAAAALAAGALGASSAPEATEALAAIVGQDHPARHLAMGALARQGTPAAAAALGKLLAVSDPVQRRQAQAALERMQTSEAKQLFRWEPAARDDFEGKPSLRWRTLQEDPSGVSYDKTPGAVTISTHAGEFHRDRTDYRNVFLLENPAGAGDFQLTVCVVNFTPDAPYQQAALLCWNDHDNYLKLSYECSPNGPSLAVIPENGGAVTTRADVPNVAHNGRLWLRLTKCGDRYEYATSVDGQSFQTYGQIAWGDGRPQHLGFTAVSGGQPDAPSIDAAFDYFEISLPKGEAVVDPADIPIAEATRAIEARPGEAALRFQRGDLYARRARWKEAAADFAKGLELDPSDHWHWYRYAALCLQLENDKEYRRACKELLQRFGGANVSFISERIGKICSFHPNPVEPQEARRLARLAVQTDPQSNVFYWFLLAQGIADYRAGDFPAAVASLTQCLEKTPEAAVDCRIPAHLFLSMARHKTGDRAAYERELKAGRDLIDQRLAKPDRGQEIGSWNDWILAHLARKEAESLAKPH